MYKRFVVLLIITTLFTSCSVFDTEPEPVLRTGVVQVGKINDIVIATGQILAEQHLDLMFEQPGIVEEIFVDEGDVVSQGDLLIRLNTDLQDAAVDQAELTLQMRNLELERLHLPPSEAEIKAARAAVNSAYAAYQELTQEPDAELLRDTEEYVKETEDAYQEMLADLEDMKARNESPELIEDFEFDVKASEINAWNAQLQWHRLVSGPDDYMVSMSWASVAQAQAELDRLREGPTELEIRQAEIQIQQAELALDRATAQREQALLYAPIDGIVAEISVQEGVLSSTIAPAVVLVDLSAFRIEAVIDEIDIALIAVGLPVEVTLDALPDQLIHGEVTDIAPSATSIQGITNYLVGIELESDGIPLRSGMSVTANIVIKRLEDVLLVPNWAVRFDREAEKAYVSVFVDEDTAPEEVEVEIGLRGDFQSQIISGLEEGQTVAISLDRDMITDIFTGD